jgi:hypothetical protein
MSKLLQLSFFYFQVGSGGGGVVWDWLYLINSYSVFGTIRILLPVCRLSWFLYALNIYAHYSSHFSQQLLIAEISPYFQRTHAVNILNTISVTRVKNNKINCELMLTYDTPALRQTGSRNLTGQNTLPTIWGTYMKHTHWTYMLIFRHIFLSNYWWQKSDIWSQASYRYPILWEAFLNPSDSYFLFADFVDIKDICSGILGLV